MGESGSTAANPNLGTKIMKNLAGGGKDREKPREKVEKRLTEVKRLHDSIHWWMLYMQWAMCIMRGNYMYTLIASIQ